MCIMEINTHIPFHCRVAFTSLITITNAIMMVNETVHNTVVDVADDDDKSPDDDSVLYCC